MPEQFQSQTPAPGRWNYNHPSSLLLLRDLSMTTLGSAATDDLLLNPEKLRPFTGRQVCRISFSLAHRRAWRSAWYNLYVWVPVRLEKDSCTSGLGYILYSTVYNSIYMVHRTYLLQRSKYPPDFGVSPFTSCTVRTVFPF